jgi:hypothetical protein
VTGYTGLPDLAAGTDLDLMGACRHAAVLAGHDLPGELQFLRAAGAAPSRGLAATGRARAGRGSTERGEAVASCWPLRAPTHQGKLP